MTVPNPVAVTVIVYVPVVVVWLALSVMYCEPATAEVTLTTVIGQLALAVVTTGAAVNSPQ